MPATLAERYHFDMIYSPQMPYADAAAERWRYATHAAFDERLCRHCAAAADAATRYHAYMFASRCRRHHAQRARRRDAPLMPPRRRACFAELTRRARSPLIVAAPVTSRAMRRARYRHRDTVAMLPLITLDYATPCCFTLTIIARARDTHLLLIYRCAPTLTDLLPHTPLDSEGSAMCATRLITGPITGIPSVQ